MTETESKAVGALESVVGRFTAYMDRFHLAPLHALRSMEKFLWDMYCELEPHYVDLDPWYEEEYTADACAGSIRHMIGKLEVLCTSASEGGVTSEPFAPLLCDLKRCHGYTDAFIDMFVKPIPPHVEAILREECSL